MSGRADNPALFDWSLVRGSQRLRIEGPLSRVPSRRRLRELPLARLNAALRQWLDDPGDPASKTPTLAVHLGRRQLTFLRTGEGCGVLVDSSRQQRRLEESARRARQLEEGIDALPEAFVLYDDEDRLLIANPRYAQLYPTIADLVRPGVSFGQIAAAAVERGQFLFDEPQEAWLRRRIDFHRQGVGFFEQRLADGRWIQLSERRTRSGGIASIRADITLLREREAALQEAKLSAEQTSRSMSRFLAVFSHEVRNGLNGLVGAAQILALDARTSGQRDQAELLFESSRRLTRVLSDLLDYLKNEAAGVGIHAQPMAPDRILETAFAEFEVLTAERGLRLALRLGAGLPAQVMGDAGRIQQVMANLTSNAIKYSRSGTITLALDVVDGKLLRYSVSDEGMGIDAQDLKGLFEFFSRASPDNPHSTGLGLAISRQIVLAMQGHIGVQSTLGRGSRFWFDLPLPALAAAGDAAAPALAEGDDALVPAISERAFAVGVLDDDELSRSIAAHFVQRLGHAAVPCRDGADALRLAREGRLDALLLDLMMPGENGVDIARRIRAQAEPGCARLAIVVVTGNVLPDSLSACQAAGADAVVQKPLFIGSLDQVLRMAVAARESGALPATAHVQVHDEAVQAQEDAGPALQQLRRDIGEQHFRVGASAALALFESLQSALAGADSDALPTLLHRAQGTAPQLGFVALGQAARRLAQAREADAQPELAQAARQLAQLLAAARTQLRAHLAAGGTAPR
ncbi:ATP-binding protein [Variovorax sp. OV329]|uniref:ATP-binding protein n=1 Tax=Variovorax sp. OV329 TaxID=1882825 RepID=UPI0008E43459|nr:ATP-binding protein [Variovorax sp. OV329]SFM93723.1 Signal transduction histidine kinase [Variovorax sp. OV329]